ncbi:hypothetical protein ZWY2020_032374 [Hordeum vulgare]|nr:hypothetical protein ZWY2020_032374 [Hordeum vulgare]
MEGKKKGEKAMAAAVGVLVILLSARRLPVGVADPNSAFCQCYLVCFQFDPDCSLKGWQSCHDYCCNQACHSPGDADFDGVCGGRYQASICGTGVEAAIDDATSSTTTEDAAASYRSRRRGKAEAEAKHG